VSVTQTDGLKSAGHPPSPDIKGSGFARGRLQWGKVARHQQRKPLWMLLPGGAAVLLIIIIPVILTVVLSLLNVNVSTLHLWLRAPFIGLRNYVDAFTQPSIFGVSLVRSILITVSFSLLTTVIITPIGVLAALSVHRPFRGRGLVRAVYLIPYVIPTFVTALMARIMFLNQTGLVDVVLSALGIASRNTYWLIGPNAFWAMLFVELWATWPFIYMMTLAGLQAIPKQVYEAAELDGASYWQKIRWIALPQIGRLLALGMLLSTLNHFASFTLPFVMFSSPPPASVAVLTVNSYFNAFSSFEFGIASAMAVVTLVILFIPGYLYIRATRMSAAS
jgi:multiple sugar transport system permease protein